MTPVRLWAWSKDAVLNFMVAARKGRGTLHVAAGLDAALATDLEGITPAMAKMWIDILTSPMFKGRSMTMTFKQYEVVSTPEGDMVRVKINLTPQFLRDVCMLNPDRVATPATTEQVTPMPVQEVPDAGVAGDSGPGEQRDPGS